MWHRMRCTAGKIPGRNARSISWSRWVLGSKDTSGVRVILGGDGERPDDRSLGLFYGENRRNQTVLTLRFRLLRAGTTGGAPLPPLEVECKPLWQPENVARAFCPIRVARTLDRMPLRKSCLSAGEQLSFIRRLARGF